jgi:hypothetical protein
MGPAGDMIIFLKMVNAMQMTIRWKIKSVGAELAAMGGTRAFAALQPRDRLA